MTSFKNRLADASSPYLRQHAENPVAWWPWIPEALEEAKRRQVPIHLSIGYAACHWCHVMARESFSEPKIADQLNRDFVNIKVDREERPDVDQIYMKALHALGEQGGWPLTMFLTPDGEPFWGGTYFPPEPRWGRPGFPQILAAVFDAWQRQDDAVTKNASALRSVLSETPRTGAADPALLDRAAATILSVWDPVRGSFQGAPKFPNAAVLDTLWRAFLRSGDERYAQAVTTTLTFLCQGGIYDHVGGGFSRYSVDAEWKVPHFEKMLYDNGLLLRLLALAYRHEPSPLFRQRIEETCGWLLREMRQTGGAFAASLDADTDHEEGLTYVWTPDELKTVLGETGNFGEIYGVTPSGNFDGKTILNRLAPASSGWLGDEEEARLAAQRALLLEARNARPQPGLDDKILADWNGLAISGMAMAARALGRDDWRDAAVAAFDFVRREMEEGGRLAHAYSQGRVSARGLATDHANMIRAALDLFAATNEPSYLDAARSWARTLDDHYLHSLTGTYFLSADDAHDLIARPRSIADEATPAATGIMVGNLAELFLLTADTAYRERAETLLATLGGEGGRDVVTSASLQSGFDTLLRGRLAVIVGEGNGCRPLVQAALAEADPALVVLEVDDNTLPDGHPAAGKVPRGGTAALFLCDAFRCLPEIASPVDAQRTLKQTRSGLTESHR